jgi:uncharacterized membrane protein YphA (DoxX/SURF4 family)
MPLFARVSPCFTIEWYMSQSTADPAEYLGTAVVDLPQWKSIASSVFAVLLAILFFVSGCWKLSDPFQWSQAMEQFRVPADLALPFSIAVGVAEAFGAVLIVIPRLRRWGGILISLLLVAFMLYIGVNYNALVGKECSCFPLVKRAVGPGFFVGDAVMLAMSLAAAAWSRRPSGLRTASVILGAVLVFAGVSFGSNLTRQSGLQAPDTITVDGKSYSLQQGNIFLFFYDPECMHCDAAARRMSKLDWKDTKVVAIPTRQAQFAAAFLHDSGLVAGTSLDLQRLRDTFKFVDPPYGVALVRGHQKAVVSSFDDSEPAKTLSGIGFVQAK